MDIFSADFISALFAIIVIDLMLAGDNAIVIALAARNVPKNLQKRAILWGMFGAIAMRMAMTVVVVWLLNIPGLLLLGGLLLIWIAYRLLLPDECSKEEHVSAASSFWGAMRTIVVADAIMGLDNVLAVAGAAHGSFLLVIIGLLISVPIVIWGSGFILRYVERYPAIVYFGAAILAWTAVNMITGEALLKSFFSSNAAIVPLAYMLVVCGVLSAGFLKNHYHLESRISKRLADFARQGPSANPMNSLSQGEMTMQKILLPVDGSPNSIIAVRRVVLEYMNNSSIEIHLVNVQPVFSRYVARFLSKKNLDGWHREEARKALMPCRELLEQHSIPYTVHIEKGEKAEVIVATANRLQCDLIIMGTARKNSLTRMLESSVTNQVLELTSVPVEIIAGSAVSKLESLGLPAGLSAAIATLVYIAFD